MSKITHGIYHFLKTGEFHPSIRSRARLKKELEKLGEDLRQNIPDLNVQKEILLNESLFCIGVLWLARLYIGKVGIFKEEELKKGVLDLQPYLGKQMISFLNTVRQNLLALGLESKEADKVLAPYEIAEEEKEV